MSETEATDDEFELDPESELVALHLATGSSHAQAALAIGRGAKWVQRRLITDERFKARVEALKAERIAQASAGLGALLERAIQVVDRNLDAERPIDQLNAARLVFDRFRQFRADADMAEQVDELKVRVFELRGALEELEAGRKGQVR